MTDARNLLVLRGVFIHLRRHGVPLGVRDYLAGVRALRAGYGGPRRGDLQRLCEALWARREEETRLIQHWFLSQPHPSPDLIRRFAGGAATEQTSHDTDRKWKTRETEDRHLNVPVEFSGQQKPEDFQIPRVRVTLPDAESYILTEQPVIPERDLIIAWRRFRRPLRTGPRVELDLAATIDDRCRHGYAVAPVFVPSRRNQARIVVLVDVSPSMLAWKSFISVLVDSLAQSQLASWAIYYFHNTPGDPLYVDARLLTPITLGAAFRRHPEAALVVLSDAGAVLGEFEDRCATKTQRFLKDSHSHWFPRVWINPMPSHRWPNTTAQEVRDLTGMAMIELSSDGIVRAVDVLRGYEAR